LIFESLLYTCQAKPFPGGGHAGVVEDVPDAEWDDFDEEAALEEEEEVTVLGGEGYSAEQLAAAERRLEQSQARHADPSIYSA